MNFEKWFNINCSYGDDENQIRKGWNICKKEVLKIIIEHEKAIHWNGLDFNDKEYIKKIKKL